MKATLVAFGSNSGHNSGTDCAESHLRAHKKRTFVQFL